MHINYILFAFSLLFLYTTIVIVHKTAERSLQGFPSANLTFLFVKRGSTHEFESHLDHIDENGTHLCHAMCPLVATIFDGLSREKAVWLRSKEGDRVSVLVHTEPLFQNGKTLGAIEYFYKI